MIPSCRVHRALCTQLNIYIMTIIKAELMNVKHKKSDVHNNFE